MHDGRAHEIARAIQPFAALPPASVSLAVCEQPVALGQVFTLFQPDRKVRIGGTGFGEGVDQTAKNSDVAAASAMPPSHIVST